MTMNKKVFFALFFSGLMLVVGTIVAQDLSVNFPIAELGNCQNKEDCRQYCDNIEHFDACMDFAKANNLLSDEKIQEAKESLEKMKDTPGQCKGRDECRTYCENPEHIDECTDFAKKHGLVSEEEALKIKKTFGVGPGGCKGEECKEYCRKPENHITCIDFAVGNGFMTQEEAEKAKKFAGKTGPGGCQGEDCKAYCEEESHQEECLTFAKEHGLIDEKEAERAEKFMKEGGPGRCKGKMECQKYCQENSKECFSFAKERGLMSKDEEENFEVGQRLHEKLKEAGGPGGCTSEQECKTYCSDASHVEECIAFASAHAGIPAEKAREMLRRFSEDKFRGEERFDRQKDFERMREEHLKRFEEFKQLEETFRGKREDMEFEGDLGDRRPEGFVGPGGCTEPAECIKYCSEHKEECFSFGGQGKPEYKPGEGGIPPGHDFPQIRPGIMQKLSPEEYEKCKANPEACREYIQPEPSGEKPCPAMPTVSECPEGQMKIKIFSSPECGEFYQCKIIGEGGNYPSPENMTEKCSMQGGTFDGKMCHFPLPSGDGVTGTSEPSLQQAPYPTQPLSSPMEECAKRGGIWTGEYCKIPDPAEYENDQSGSLHTRDMLANLFQTISDIFQLNR